MNKETLQSLTILIPPKREQIAIADLLSTWDKAIKVKDHLIEEKKRQKKWLMHNLLNDDWQDLSLGEICDIIMGQSPDSKAYNENNIGLPLIQGNTDCQGRITKPRMWTTQITKTCDVGDIILTVRAPVGSVAIADQQACIGRGVCAIRSEDDQPFIFQYLLSVEKKWARVSQGTTFDAISGDEIRKIKIKYPPPEERSTIANILSTADREIDLHEQHLVELKKQKKALMQLLLTGIVRVNAREVS